MGADKKAPPKADESKYLTTELLHSAPLKLHSGSGSVELARQRRRRDDGKLGHEFLTVLVKTGRQPVPYDAAVVRQLHTIFGDMLDKMNLEEKKIEAERAQRQREWEERIANQQNNGDRKTRRTGKTERKRRNREAAGQPTDPGQRKAIKSKKDQQIRAAAQGKKGG